MKITGISPESAEISLGGAFLKNSAKRSKKNFFFTAYADRAQGIVGQLYYCYGKVIKCAKNRMQDLRKPTTAKQETNKQNKEQNQTQTQKPAPRSDPDHLISNLSHMCRRRSRRRSARMYARAKASKIAPTSAICKGHKWQLHICNAVLFKILFNIYMRNAKPNSTRNLRHSTRTWMVGT